MSITLALVVAILFAVGTWLLLHRALGRIVLGVVILGHGAVLLLQTAGGAAGRPAFVGTADPAEMADPLVQALALTGIVITFGIVAYLLALSVRNWQHTGDDNVEDDIEDSRIAHLSERDAEEQDRT